MTIAGYRPRNTFLRRQLDTRWRRWVSWCIGGAAAVSVVMAAFVAPRQATLRMRYEIARLTSTIDHLEGEQRRLKLERETLTSPPVLAADLASLGLEQVPPTRIIRMTAGGELLFPQPTATPKPGARTPDGEHER
jgi:hypothetical protein